MININYGKNKSLMEACEPLKELDKLIKSIKVGDTIIFGSVSRMSRNSDDGFKLYQELYNNSVELVFLKEPHINTSTYRKTLQEEKISINLNSGDKATNVLIKSILTISQENFT